MPLARRKGKSAAHKKAIGEAIYRAMRETFVVPDEDRFMVVPNTMKTAFSTARLIWASNAQMIWC